MSAKPDTVAETIKLFSQGKNMVQIARARDLIEATIQNHLRQYYLQGGEIELKQFIKPDIEKQVLQTLIMADDLTKLAPIKEVCPEDITYDDIKWVIAKLQRIKLF